MRAAHRAQQQADRRLPIGDHHDDILTILAPPWKLDHLVALALFSLLDVHLLDKGYQISQQCINRELLICHKLN